MRTILRRFLIACLNAKVQARPMWLDEPPIKIVCCYCTPHHVMRAGAEPASHGACPIGIARFESGASA